MGDPAQAYGSGSRRNLTRNDYAVAVARLLSQMYGPQSPFSDGLKMRLRDSPAAISALQELVTQFKPELIRLNVDVDAAQAHLAALAQTAPHPLVSRPFPDVSPNHWAASSVEMLRRYGLVAGYPDGTYTTR